MRKRSLLLLIGPGLLTAATGVGAGDLATAGFAGSRLGLAILWAVVLGAFLKYVLSEGLTRWQLATGETVLEGGLRHLGPVATGVFAIYFLPWSFFTGAALISACAITANAMLPTLIGTDASPLLVGAIHSVIGVALVWFGGFKWIERIMAVLIAIMFATVILTAVFIGPDLVALARGLVVPTIPEAGDGGLTWTIALMGGVGGTLTIICYGYWIREAGRVEPSALALCRVDLAVGYGLTAIFGLAMIVIASGLPLDAKGANLIVALGDRLETSLGPGAKWLFLVGAWAAVFSSLLGVWQAVPYVFADFLRIARKRDTTGVVDTSLPSYRVFLVALAIVPIIQVAHPFREVQKYYAIIGAAFIPLLAGVLLYLNTRKRLGAMANRPITIAILGLTLVLAAVAGYLQVRSRFG